MGRIESPLDRQAQLDADRDPVSELHAYRIQMMPQLSMFQRGML